MRLVKSTLVIAGIILLSLQLQSCKRKAKEEKAEEVLAEIGEVKITVKDFQDTINSYTPYLRSKYNSFEKKKEKLEKMIRFELLALEAKKRGYDKDPMVQRGLKQSLIRELVKREVEDKVKLDDITDEECKKYYDEHPEKYNKPAQRRMAHILIKDEATAKKVLQEALAEEMNPVKFRDLVIKYSQDPKNKMHGGDMGYFSRWEERTPYEPQVEEKLVRALYSLEKVGQIHKKLIKTEEGYHIIKFTSTRPEIHRSFDQVKRQIKSILWREKREKLKRQFIESLRKKANVVIHEDVLDEIEIPEKPVRAAGRRPVPDSIRPESEIAHRGISIPPGPVLTPVKPKPSDKKAK